MDEQVGLKVDGQIVRFLPDHAEEFRRCMVDCDVAAIKELWAYIAPKLPQPETDEDALVCIHMARTAANRLPFRSRAYSHAWLTERNLRSLMPDKLKPRAERMYPRIVSAVGICVAGLGNKKTEYHHYVSTQLCNLVADLYASGITDPAVIKTRMNELHNSLRKQK